MKAVVGLAAVVASGAVASGAGFLLVVLARAGIAVGFVSVLVVVGRAVEFVE